MTKQQAQSLIGSHVRAYTSANGIYVGTLQKVLALPWRPWPGEVLITGVLQVATHFEQGRGFCRRGFRPGQTIQVGGIHIEPFIETGFSYKEALEQSLQALQTSINNSITQKYTAALRATVEANERILQKLKEEEFSPHAPLANTSQSTTKLYSSCHRNKKRRFPPSFCYPWRTRNWHDCILS